MTVFIWIYVVPAIFCFLAFCIDDFFTVEQPVDYKTNLFYSLVPGYNFITAFFTLVIILAATLNHLIWKIKGLV